MNPVLRNDSVYFKSHHCPTVYQDGQLYQADLLINRSKPHHVASLYEDYVKKLSSCKEQDNAMENEELIDSIMEMIKTSMLTTKTSRYSEPPNETRPCTSLTRRTAIPIGLQEA